MESINSTGGHTMSTTTDNMIPVYLSREEALSLLEAAGFQRRPGAPPDTTRLPTTEAGPGNYVGPGGYWGWELDEATARAIALITEGY
jgi:hypothetical protein